VSGPSLRRALQDWGAEFTLEVVCDPDVPDLGVEEFRLRLPGLPSVRDLDRLLHPFLLRARREGRVVRISTDRAWARFRPELKALWEAKDAAGRLELFLSGSKVDGAGLAALVQSWFQPGSGAQGYHPRVELEAELAGNEQLAKLPLDPRRPLSQQLFALRASGYLLEAKDGILRIGKVPGWRPATRDK
jgi:hypothetical protein